ncbi:MAG: phosphate ABC transporter substrate-binding protein PstS [Dictyoglomus thermophilum]|nr:phosphate ABC transporter substrate-binding protein PstS [Dictyoglomus thermophilum]MCX7720792.1 phosphate ABC transporter substrate-binding protein PstS [Dictyoglomus thermophilum]
MRKWILLLMILLLSSVSLGQQVIINGAGATFPYPLYSRWFYEFERETGIKINYQSVGSGAGIQQAKAGTVDFGATDAPLPGKEQEESKLIMIPTVAGSVAIVYNLPNVEKGLKLSREVIADIYLGKIKKWDDPKIKALNKDINLPSIPIVVARRSDGSGTTAIFTNFLSAVSSEWKEKVGAGTSVNWPVGIGGKGNEGVAGIVKNTIGAIGYVEFAYAVQNKLSYAQIKNKYGSFVEPSIDTVKYAASFFKLPEDFAVYIVDAPGKNSYPIAGYTFLLLKREYQDLEKAKAIVKFIRWAYEKGDKYAEELLYVPLPDNVKKLALKKLELITYQGKKVVDLLK